MYSGSKYRIENEREIAPLAELDREEFEWKKVVDSYYERIFAFCYQFLGSRADAEDATQDTFVRARRGLSELKSAAALKSWLYRIARNICIDRKRWWTLRTLVAPNEIVGGHSPTQELAVVLRQLVSKLPKRQREVFILRHWHECSTTETAEILGIDEGSVKSHLSRGVGKLKEWLEGDGKPT